MKVVMISGNPYGKDYGGVAVHVKYLHTHLSNYNDIKIDLVTFGHKNKIYEKNGIKYTVLKRMKFGKILFPLEMFYDLFRLERVVKKINPDLIHIQSTIPLFSLLGIHIIKKYPILITLHGYIKEEYKFHVGIKKILNRIFGVPLERLALLKIPYIITVCPQIKNLIKKITKSKIFVIPNGINFKNIQKIQPVKKYDNPTIYYMGVLNKRKGVHDLIKATTLVKNKVKNVKLFIAGTGPYINKLKQLVADEDLKDDVTFLGFLSEQEKFIYMKSTDIFVLPTYWESFPFVLIEALACGKPIVTTDVAGNPFAVSNGVNGFLVKPGDWKQIAERLITLLTDKDLIKKMGRQSEIKATMFDWEIIAKQTRELYCTLADHSDKEINNKRE